MAMKSAGAMAALIDLKIKLIEHYFGYWRKYKKMKRSRSQIDLLNFVMLRVLEIYKCGNFMR